MWNYSQFPRHFPVLLTMPGKGLIRQIVPDGSARLKVRGKRLLTQKLFLAPCGVFFVPFELWPLAHEF
jgi:hypothetical protein